MWYSENVDRAILTSFSFPQFSHTRFSFQNNILAKQHDFRKGFNLIQDPARPGSLTFVLVSPDER